MEHTAINIATGHGIERISASCGEVTVGCTDVAGIIEAVMTSSQRLRSEHSALQETVAALETDQLRVAQASDEARDQHRPVVRRQRAGQIADGIEAHQRQQQLAAREAGADEGQDRCAHHHADGVCADQVADLRLADRQAAADLQHQAHAGEFTGADGEAAQ